MVSGCVPGTRRLLGKPLDKELSILVTVSDEAAHTDELGGIASLVEAITEELADRGIRHQVFAADGDHPPAPRIEIHIEKWDLGDVDERNRWGATAIVSPIVSAAGTLATAGGYEVTCAVYREKDFDPAYNHTFTGAILGTSTDASASAGTSVGRKILAAALDGGRDGKGSEQAPS